MMVKNISDPFSSLFQQNAGETDGRPRAGGGPVLCGDLPIRIDHEGQWFYHGSPINRQKLVKLFASVLERDEEGRYWLITPQEKGKIQVDDVPFLGVEMFAAGAGPEQTISFRTNLDDRVTLDRDHPLRMETNPETGETRPYVLVRGRLRARLTRSVYYELVDLGVETRIDGRLILGLWSSGTFFRIGELDDD